MPGQCLPRCACAEEAPILKMQSRWAGVASLSLACPFVRMHSFPLAYASASALSSRPPRHAAAVPSRPHRRLQFAR
eukprot:4035224-Pleurochrysis_carterae.AAC.2